MNCLKLSGITIRFGGLTAAHDICIDVPEKRIVAVIGPNGAGKTTIFNSITGVYRPSEGTIQVFGRDIREPLSGRIILRGLKGGLVAGVLSVLFVNAQTLWEAAINSRYAFGQPFAWADAVKAAWDALKSLSLVASLLPFVVSFFVVCAGTLAWWARSRHTPLTAAKNKIARTFQNIRIFPEMIVIDNVLVGMHRHFHSHWSSVLFGLPRARREEETARAKALETLSFVGLAEHATTRAASLPYGHQRRLEIARALASQPALILLDEPAAGMNPSELSELIDLISRIREAGHTVLLIEHHMKLVMAISDEITVLEYGRKIAHGTPDEVQANPRVISAYLGATESE